jgi:hypothetical protein
MALLCQQLKLTKRYFYVNKKLISPQKFTAAGLPAIGLAQKLACLNNKAPHQCIKQERDVDFVALNPDVAP